MSIACRVQLAAIAFLTAILLIHVSSCTEPTDTTDSTALTTVDWYWDNPVPTGEVFSDFWGNGPNDVWAVGHEGTIFHYDGSDWTQYTIAPSVRLKGIWGTAANNIYAVGDFNIYHYDGSVWSIIHTTDKTLEDISGSGPSDIWAIGISKRVHYDGTAWTDSPGKTHFAVWVNSPNDVYAGGSDYRLQHYDGTSWTTSIDFPPGTVLDIWASGPNDVYAVGRKNEYDGFVHHFDGTEWAEVAETPLQWLCAVWGSAANDIYAVGVRGLALHYDGTQWSEITLPQITSMYSIWGTSASDVFIGGYPDLVGLGGSSVLHYDGSAWTALSRGPRIDLTAAWSSSDQNVYAVGDDGFILHFDGRCWWPMDSGTDVDLWSIHGSSPSNIYAVGAQGTILRFNGSQWSPQSSGTDRLLKDVWVASASDAFAVGGVYGPDEIGMAIHFDGTNWHDISFPAAGDVGPVWGTSPTSVYVSVAYNLHKYDGVGWSRVYASPVGGLFEDIWGTSDDDIFIVGSEFVHHYDGNEWTQTRLIFEGVMGGVWGRANDDVYAVGWLGKTFHYDGTTWTHIPTGCGQFLHGVTGGASTVYAVGKFSTILSRGAASASMGLTTACYNFDELPSDGRWRLGESFTTRGLQVDVVPFKWGDGRWSSSGSIRSNGSTLYPSNVSADFKILCPVQEVSFKYVITGGNVNIRINGEHREAADINALNGQVIGGAQLNSISTLVGGDWQGAVSIVGNIKKFEIGGQEMHIEDLCFSYQ